MESSRPYVILCIDDGVIALQARTLVLQHSGYHILTALSAKEGMALFRRRHVDLVLTDHFLDDCPGTALAAEMKRLKPDVPVAILSGATELPEGVEQADLFISKLEPTSVVLERIGELLHKTGGAV